MISVFRVENALLHGETGTFRNVVLAVLARQKTCTERTTATHRL